MRRSEINQLIREAEQFFQQHHFVLPSFAAWNATDWKKENENINEIITCSLGWDVTDFGHGDFMREGLLLFTIRNGCLNHPVYSKPYAEKIMIAREDQLTLMHCHLHKTEDIINRGGGRLVFKLYNRKGEKDLADTPVILQQDGIKVSLPAGSQICLTPGESITLTPGIFHQFWAEKGTGDVMIGEVSSVNDDHRDNVFYYPQLRFPEIIEDEAPYRLMIGDYFSLNPKSEKENRDENTI
jgi:D-lyxose ketol-isomerase